MPLVILENRTRRPRRMLTLNLPREIAPVRSVVRTRVEAKDGTRRIKVVDRNVGGSLRVPYGAVSQPVPEAYLHAPDIKAAVLSRELRIIREGDPRWGKALKAADPKRARNAARAKIRAARNGSPPSPPPTPGPKARRVKAKPPAE